MENLEFTQDWCSHNFTAWKRLIAKYKPATILEIGSYEGRSALFWLTQSTTKQLYCLDTWSGSVEHHDLDVRDIEIRFDKNVSKHTNVIKMKDTSLRSLSKLVDLHSIKFDLIYIDGSHHPQDVLVDAVLCFNLCNIGGIVIFDDYLWINRQRFGPWHGDLPKTLLPHPKTAVDAFCNIYEDRIKIIESNYQLCYERIK